MLGASIKKKPGTKPDFIRLSEYSKVVQPEVFVFSGSDGICCSVPEGYGKPPGDKNVSDSPSERHQALCVLVVGFPSGKEEAVMPQGIRGCL